METSVYLGITHMCGVAGFWSAEPSYTAETLYGHLALMSSAMQHRGPDANGIWVDQNHPFGLAHQRLSILDLTNAGSQPMLSPSGRYVISYNGEIYNHLNLRELCPSQSWSGSSDTETILALIDSLGIRRTLLMLQGMFAFALWDRHTSRLTLVRDRFGEKPLYYGLQNLNFFFASDLSALTAHPHFQKSLNTSVLSSYLASNYIPTPGSIYRDVFKLLPATFLTLGINDLQTGQLPSPEAYYDPTSLALSLSNKAVDLPYKESLSNLQHLLRSTVASQSLSDVPIGSFLSGGIDSSLITAILQETSPNPVKTFTIGFTDPKYNESSYAANVAEYLGTDHTCHIFSDDDLLHTIPSLAKVFSEPFSDSSQIPSLLLSSLTSNSVSVVLTGDGGDELFGGYNRYNSAFRIWSLLSHIPYHIRSKLCKTINNNGLLSAFESLLVHLSKLNPGFLQNITVDKIDKALRLGQCPTIDDIYSTLTKHTPDPSYYILSDQNYQASSLPSFSSDPRLSMMLLDTATYLPDDILVKVDRCTMYNSLESRCPFLNPQVFEFAWSLPMNYKFSNQSGKRILKDLLKSYLPPTFFDRPKMGFSVPLSRWLRGPLKAWANDLLSPSLIKRQGILNPYAVNQLWLDYLSHKSSNSYLIWNLLIFQSWLDT